MKRPALIFDFGNVIAFFDYARACDRLGRRHGIEGEALLRRAREAGFLGLVSRYESGQIDTEAFVREAVPLLGLPITPEQFAEAWADVFWINPPVALLAARLKQAGYRLVLGSNTNPLHSEWYRRRFREELACFDRLVLSYEVGHLKPSAAFYHACAEAAGLAPGDCVFIDDLPENVEGARAAGLQAILYTDPRSLVAGLGALGVEVPDIHFGGLPGRGDVKESDVASLGEAEPLSGMP